MFRALGAACYVIVTALAVVPSVEAAPRITSISPRGGSIAGGRVFRLRGVDLDMLPSGTVGVVFGDAAATEVSVVNSREIRGKTPPHAVGTVDVKVAVDGVPYEAAGSESFRYVEGTAVPCTSAAECDDGDPCTLDSCSTACVNAAVDSTDDATAGTPACATLTVPKKIGKKFVAGCRALGQRATAPTEKRKAKLRTLAIKSFTVAGKVASKAKPLAGDCATQLGTLLDGAKTFAESQ